MPAPVLEVNMMDVESVAKKHGITPIVCWKILSELSSLGKITVLHQEEQGPNAVMLNSDRLIELGFQKREEKEAFRGDRYFIDYTPVNVLNTLEVEEIDTNLWMWISGNFIVHIRTVDKLQLLYFVLSGEVLSPIGYKGDSQSQTE